MSTTLSNFGSLGACVRYLSLGYSRHVFAAPATGEVIISVISVVIDSIQMPAAPVDCSRCLLSGDMAALGSRFFAQGQL